MDREKLLAYIIGYAIMLTISIIFMEFIPSSPAIVQASLIATVDLPNLKQSTKRQSKHHTDTRITGAADTLKNEIASIVPHRNTSDSEGAEGEMSMADVIKALAPVLRPLLEQTFTIKGLSYPPSQLTIIALKEERRLELWSPDTSGTEQFVMSFPILGASGTLGPKLRRGDLQVPEGVYRVLWFNPNSQFYLSLKLDYPNAFDHSMAGIDGRLNLGGDIFIHGYDVSLGCLAIGNPAIEKLFLLVYDTGRQNTRVIIAPYDFREKSAPLDIAPVLPAWTEVLYEDLKEEMKEYDKLDEKTERLNVISESLTSDTAPSIQLEKQRHRDITVPAETLDAEQSLVSSEGKSLKRSIHLPYNLFINTIMASPPISHPLIPPAALKPLAR